MGNGLSLGDKLSSAWACWDEALEQPESLFGVKAFRWICAALVLDYTQSIDEHGPMYREPPLEIPSRIPSTVVSTAAPSVANSRTSTPNPPSPILTRPHSPEKTISAGCAGTKGSRRKERERQARENQLELARLDALAELGREAEGGGEGAWEIAEDEGKDEDGWGGGGWGDENDKTLAPLPAPKLDGWSSVASGGDRVGAAIRSWADCVGGSPRRPTAVRAGTGAQTSVHARPLPPPSAKDFPALSSEPTSSRFKIDAKPTLAASSTHNISNKLPSAPRTAINPLPQRSLYTVSAPSLASSNSTVISENRSGNNVRAAAPTHEESTGWDSPPSATAMTGWGDEATSGEGDGSGWEIKETSSSQDTNGGWGAEWE